MRTTRRLAVVSAVLGGGLLLAGPAVAQDKYPADQPIGGAIDQPAEDVDDDTDSTGDGETVVSGSSGGGASLPFTGGEVTLIALAGTAALGGGIALTAAGRKRKPV